MDSQVMYLEAWKQSADAVVELVPTLSQDQLAAPTDCPGWRVHDVVAHLAHLEEVLNGEPEQPNDSSTVSSDYTEAGVRARRDVPAAELADRIARDVAARYARLSGTSLDLSAPAPVTPRGVGWTWETLLRNRAVDMWVHEQDIRRAVGQPGNLDSPGAHVTTHSFASGMGFVLGKKVAAPAGTVVAWDLDGGVPLSLTLEVGDDGRARQVDAGTPATTTLRMSAETFTVLGAGRRRPEQVEIQVEGDADLGGALVAAMTLTF